KSFFFQAEDGIRDFHVTGVQTCALPIFTYLLYTLFFFASFASSKAWGQSYGLGFYGQEVVQDQRTGLELGYENPLCVKERFKLRSEERRVGKEGSWKRRQKQ